uniref:Phosphatidylethanolamine-binding protein n=1 Tax=Heligmosomoides polygyrus TaxID=6339 RepID=A0A183FVM5_HELPZ
LSELQVTFQGYQKASLGNELSPSAALSEPTLGWKADSNTLYTVIMVDPDAPSRKNPFLSDYLHWLVVNVRGNSVKNGDELASYRGPAPPPGSGAHRYYLLLYKQRRPITMRKMKSRANFNTLKYARDNGLDGPVAGNYFKVSLFADNTTTRSG